DAQEVNEAFLAVGLPEEAFSAADSSAVFLVIGSLLVREHITQQGIGAQVQPANLGVDLANRAELAGAVHVGLDVDGLEPLGESSGFRRAVVLPRQESFASLHILTR